MTKYPETSDSKKHIAWHQDLYLWNLNPQKALTVWVALDDASIEAGCMRAVPGSHQQGMLHHDIVPTDTSNLLMGLQRVPPALFGGEDKAVPMPLSPGQASFHDGFTVHSSPPNLSSHRRTGLTIIIMPADVKVGGYEYDTDNGSETIASDWRIPIVLKGEESQGVNHIQSAPFSSTIAPFSFNHEITWCIAAIACAIAAATYARGTNHQS